MNNKSNIIKILLVVSILLNVLLGSYIFYFKNYILSEEFSVVSMQHISKTFCLMYQREYGNKEVYKTDTFYKPFCEKVLENQK
jgi:hypothetical protein